MKSKTTVKERQGTTANEAGRLAAMAALAAGEGRAAAAIAGGVSLRTLERWHSEPGFRDALREARRQAFDQGLETLKGITCKAVEALAQLLNSKREAERRHAAVELIGFAMRAHETLEFEARLEALEKLAAEWQPGHRTRPS